MEASRCGRGCSSWWPWFIIPHPCVSSLSSTFPHSSCIPHLSSIPHASSVPPSPFVPHSSSVSHSSFAVVWFVVPVCRPPLVPTSSSAPLIPPYEQWPVGGLVVLCGMAAEGVEWQQRVSSGRGRQVAAESVE